MSFNKTRGLMIIIRPSGLLIIISTHSLRTLNMSELLFGYLGIVQRCNGSNYSRFGLGHGFKVTGSIRYVRCLGKRYSQYPSTNMHKQVFLCLLHALFLTNQRCHSSDLRFSAVQTRVEPWVENGAFQFLTENHYTDTLLFDFTAQLISY